MKKLLLGLLLLSALTSHAQGIILESTSETIELSTSTTANIDYQINFVDLVLATGGTPGASEGKITSATTTVVVSAPAASTYRLIKSILVRNINATTVNLVTIKKDISATEYTMFSVVLGISEVLTFTEGAGWQIFDSNGKLKTSDLERAVGGLNRFVMKSFTAADAAGYWYCGSKDAGIPGAWAVGAPGTAGRITDGLAVADAGCVNFPDAGSGLATYLTQLDASATALQAFYYMDLLWVNSGLVVTTTTAQTVNSITLPARDDDGTSNGKGCMIGILATAALGNAAVVSTSTVSYTNELGVAGRTATLQAVVGYQFPATPVIGTTVWFLLQAGDQGVSSIQTVTLGTSLVSGSISVIIARPIVAAPITVINHNFSNKINDGDGIRLYDRACILPFFQAQNAGTTVFSSNLTVSTR